MTLQGMCHPVHQDSFVGTVTQSIRIITVLLYGTIQQVGQDQKPHVENEQEKHNRAG